MHQESLSFRFRSTLLHPNWWKKWIQDRRAETYSLWAHCRGWPARHESVWSLDKNAFPALIACLPLSCIIVPLRHKALKYLKMRSPAESSTISRLVKENPKPSAALCHMLFFQAWPSLWKSTGSRTAAPGERYMSKTTLKRLSFPILKRKEDFAVHSCWQFPGTARC